jgi:hypothetical protein
MKRKGDMSFSHCYSFFFSLAKKVDQGTTIRWMNIASPTTLGANWH